MLKAILISLFLIVATTAVVKAVKKGNKSLADYQKTADYQKYGCAYPWQSMKQHITVSKGNKKIGKDVFHFDLLSGDGIHTLKNGAVLTNVCGTCTGCCAGCKGSCYAIRDEIQYPGAIKLRIANTHIMYTDMERGFKEIHDFIMNRENNKRIRVKVRKFRIHESGEFFSLEYMRAWVKFAEEHPFVQFYCYTKRFEWLETVYKERGYSLPKNFTVNVSIWNHNYENPYGFPEYIYDDSNITGAESEYIGKAGIGLCDCSGGKTCDDCNRCIFGKHGCKTVCPAH